MSRECFTCKNYQGAQRPVGSCLVLLYLVVARHAGPRCKAYSQIESGIAGAPARSASEDCRTAEAANSSFFQAENTPGVFHQRRCSTADQSGVPENGH